MFTKTKTKLFSKAVAVILLFQIMLPLNFLQAEASVPRTPSLNLSADTVNNKVDVEIFWAGDEDASYPDAAIELDETGLVGHWKLDGNFTDSSGNGNDGTANGGLVATADGQRRQAGSFDGVDDYVDVGTSAEFNVSDLTISAWVKLDVTLGAVSTNYYVFSNEDYNNSGYMLRIWDTTDPNTAGGISFRTSQSDDADRLYAPGKTYPNDNAWHYLVVTKNDTVGKIYLDGKEVTLTTNNSLDNPVEATLSSRIGITTTGYQPFNGSIDDVKIYNHALSQWEIEARYKKDSLVGYWKFDDVGTSVTADYSGNGNDGTLTNMSGASDYVDGQVGKALDFDGVDDWTKVISDDFKNSQMTTSVWMKTSWGQEGAMMTYNNWNNYYWWILRNDNNKPQFYYSWTNWWVLGGRVNSTVNINNGKWHHIAVSDNWDITKLFVDWVLQWTVSSPDPVWDNNMFLYFWSNRPETLNSNSFYRGDLDEATIYSRALTDSEIRQSYEATRPRFEIEQKETAASDYQIPEKIEQALIAETINDVFIYDTKKDSVDSSWRSDITKSWYTEASSAIRCPNGYQETWLQKCTRDFPETSILVLSYTNLYIYDVESNEMWMKFDRSDILSPLWPATALKSVFALKGKIYTGGSRGVGDYVGFREIDFLQDRAFWRGKQGVSNYFYYWDKVRNGNRVIDRPTWGWAAWHDLPYRDINDIHTTVIDGKTYVALATNDGVSVINETDEAVINYTTSQSSEPITKVWLTQDGKLYFEIQSNIIVYNELLDADTNNAIADADHIYNKQISPYLPTFTPNTSDWVGEGVEITPEDTLKLNTNDSLALSPHFDAEAEQADFSGYELNSLLFDNNIEIDTGLSTTEQLAVSGLAAGALSAGDDILAKYSGSNELQTINTGGISEQTFGFDLLEISTGNSHTIALDENNHVWAWGRNSYGQVADGTLLTRTSPVDVTDQFPADKTIVSISAGSNHSFALSSDGSLYAWGYNSYGNLGNGTASKQINPIEITAIAASPLYQKIITKIKSASHHTLALTDTGDVYSWGYNRYGQLGIGVDAPDECGLYDCSLWPQKITTLSGISSITAGYYHSFAISNTNQVYAWGYNAHGELGDGTSAHKDTPVNITANFWGKTITTLTWGIYHSLALASDNTVFSFWRNNYGQLGNGDAGLATQLNPVDITATFTAASKTITGLAGGIYHSLALTTDGLVYAWGGDSASIGATGLGDTLLHHTPTQISSLSNISQLGTVQNSYSSVIANDGTAYLWGLNTYGQLGDKAILNPLIPDALPSLFNLKQIEAGNNHSLALTHTDEVYTWGYNIYGELGDGTNITKHNPVNITANFNLGAGVNISKIANYNRTSLALASNGNVYTWGYNRYGMVGDGTTTNRATPVNISTIGGSALLGKNIIDIDAGYLYALALADDGTVFSWGYDASGRLGYAALDDCYTSTDNCQIMPKQISSLSNIQSININGGSSFAMNNTNQIYAWGVNGSGQLGDGTTVSKTTPVNITANFSGKTISSLAGGYYHAFALASDNTVFSWGYNFSGQLGDGSIENKYTPLDITANFSGKTITGLAGGLSHSLALASDGTAFGWGDNTYGQGGDGTTISHLTPTPVSSLSTATDISAGYYHSFALLSDDTAAGWGNNGYGRIGNGESVDRDTPWAGGANFLSIIQNGISDMTPVLTEVPEKIFIVPTIEIAQSNDTATSLHPDISTFTPLNLQFIYNAVAEMAQAYTETTIFGPMRRARLAVTGAEGMEISNLDLNFLPGILVTDLSVSETSSENTIYLGTDEGMTIIHEKQGDEASGSVKFITSEYETEEMVGDVRGMWTFDGLDSLTDNSIKTNDLTNNGGVNFSSAGVRGKAASFDGTNYLSIPDNTNLSVTSNLTVWAWVNFSDFTETHTIISKWEDSVDLPDQRWFILYSRTDGTLGSEIDSTADWGWGKLSISGTTVMLPNTWYYAVLTFNNESDKVALYLDGILDAEIDKTTDVFDNTADFQIGHSFGNSHLYMDGLIDEPFITAEALDAATIKRMYDTGKKNLEAQDSLSDGLVGYWKMDGDFSDTSGNGNHGSANGGVSTSLVNAKFGESGSFDGVDDYVEIADSDNLDITENLTVQAWIYPVETENPYGTILGKWDNVPDPKRSYSFMTRGNNSEICFFVSPDGVYHGDQCALFSIPVLNTWYHLTGTFKDGNSKIYVNGELQDEISGLSIFTTPDIPFLIGKDTGNEMFQGQIDDVSIYNRTLTSTEISRIYNSSKSLHDTAFKHRLTGTSDSVRALAVSETNRMTVATADGATEFDQFGNAIHSFSIDDSSALNTSILNNNINSVGYLDGQTVFGYNITGGIEIIQRLSDLTGLLTYLDWMANDIANPDTNTLDDGTHTVSTWNSDASVDYTWTEPNSNGTGYDYKVIAIDTDGEESATDFITNGGFEDSTESLTLYTGTTRITSDKSEGEYAISNSTGYAMFDLITSIPNSLSRSFSFCADLKQIWESTALFYVDTGVGSDGGRWQNWGIRSPTTSWDRYCQTVIVQSLSAGVDTIERVRIYRENQTGTLYVDNVTFEEVVSETITTPISLYETVCNTDAIGTGGAATQTSTGITCNFTDSVTSYVHVRTQDEAGNFSDWIHQGPYLIDTSTPEIVSIDAGASSADRTSLTSDSWFNTTGAGDTVSFSWTDSNSLSDDTFYYELNTNSSALITGTGWTSTTDNFIDNIVLSEWISYMHVRPMNGADTWGVERIFTIKYDKTTPSLDSKTTYTTDWYTNDQTSTFTFTDGGSEIASGNNPSCLISTEGTSSTCTNSLINVCDNAGNCNTTNQTSNSIKLDKSAPSGGSVSHPNTSQRDANIIVSVDAGTDTLSGLSTNNSNYLLEVTTATYNGSTCGMFSAFADANVSEINTAVEYIYSNTAVDTCYKFNYTVADILGHTVTYLSSDITVITSNGLPTDVTLDSHNDGSSSTDTTPILQFDLPADPDGDLIKYQLQLDNNVDFSSPEIDYTETNFSAGPRNNETYAVSFLGNAHWFWRVRLYDDHGGINNWTTANQGFVVDTELPESKILYPQNNASLKNVSSIVGKAADGGGVDFIRISIYDQVTKKYYNGTDFSLDAEEWLTTTDNIQGATKTKWSYTAPAWNQGSTYTIRSRATDMAGNEEHTDAVTFTYDTINGTEGSIYVFNPAVNNNSEYIIYFPNTATVPLNSYIEIDFDDSFRFSPWMKDSDIVFSDQGGGITASTDSIDRENKVITTTITGGSVEATDMLELEINNLRIHNPSATGSYVLPITIYNSVGGVIESGSGIIVLEQVYQQVELNVDIQQALQLSVDSGAVLLEVDPDVQLGQNWVGTGGVVTDKSTVEVKTNAQTGYNLMISLAGNTATGAAVLDGTTDTGNTIASSSGNRVTTESNFTFAVNSGSTATSTAFNNSSTQVSGAGTSAPTNSFVDNIFYYLNIDYTTPSDTYQGTVTYTAVGQF